MMFSEEYTNSGEDTIRVCEKTMKEWEGDKRTINVERHRM